MRGAQGCTRRYQSQGLAGRALLLRVAGYCVSCCDYTLLTERDKQEAQEALASQAQYKPGTQIVASTEQEVVRAESKTQRKRSKAENCKCGALKYRIPFKEYYKELKNAEQRPSGAKLTSRIKLPSQAKLPGRKRFSSEEKLDEESCPADQSCQGE